MDKTQEKWNIYRNLLIFGGFSSGMIFAGLISAYLVSRQDMYWVIFSAPNYFYLALSCLIISSILLHIGLRKCLNTPSLLSLIIPIALILGLVFSYFQYQGYKSLALKGLAFSAPIIYPQDSLHLKDLGTFYVSYGEQALYATGDLRENSRLCQAKAFERKNILLHNPQYLKDSVFLIFEDGFFYHQKDVERLMPLNKKMFSYAGMLMPEGFYGKDFYIQKSGISLTLDNGLFYDADDLARLTPLNEKIAQYRNNSSAYLAILIFLHVIHLFIAFFMGLYVWLRANRKKYSPENHAGLRAFVYLWDFLGILWFFLFFFLFFFNRII
jgi:heme/copper-type cytochrome/quinol oxidase subunit 3